MEAHILRDGRGTCVFSVDERCADLEKNDGIPKKLDKSLILA